jgi:hypothetical protein
MEPYAEIAQLRASALPGHRMYGNAQAEFGRLFGHNSTPAPIYKA